MTVSKTRSGAILHLHSESEGRELFERECQQMLGISAEEFVRLWRAGAYDAPEADTAEVAWLAGGLPTRRTPLRSNHPARRHAARSRRARG